MACIADVVITVLADRKLDKAERWQMWNEILNVARNIVGKEMVSPTTNPYI